MSLKIHKKKGESLWFNFLKCSNIEGLLFRILKDVSSVTYNPSPLRYLSNTPFTLRHRVSNTKTVNKSNESKSFFFVL